MLHIQAAALFVRQSYHIEKEHNGKFSNELFTEYLAYVTASIYTSVAFLESSINELFANAGDMIIESQLDSSIRKLLAEKWKSISKDRNVRIMDKFDIALKIAGKPPFDRGKNPAQDIHLLIELRNCLTHYYPEWMEEGISEPPAIITEKKYIKSLQSKFQTNPFKSENTAFFPERCLSYGCAKWGVESALAYANEFYTKLEISAPYEHIRQFIRTV